MTNIRNFVNLVDALKAVKKEGYSYDFSLKEDCLACSDLKSTYSASEFQVDELIHFEGDDSSPESRSILYLISTNADIKGTLIVAQSIYTDQVKKDILDKLHF